MFFLSFFIHICTVCTRFRISTCTDEMIICIRREYHTLYIPDITDIKWKIIPQRLRKPQMILLDKRPKIQFVPWCIKHIAIKIPIGFLPERFRVCINFIIYKNFFRKMLCSIVCVNVKSAYNQLRSICLSKRIHIF